MIAGLLDPSEGTIEMDGLVISSPASSLPPEKRKRSAGITGCGRRGARSRFG